MALTKASRSMLNTGISDSSDATALTFSSAEDATFAGHVSLADSKKIKLGAGGDLEIYHDGTHSYVADEGQGNLIIEGNNVRIQANGGAGYAFFTNGGAADLYHNGSVKFSTSSDGIDVTGHIDAATITTTGAGTIGGNLTVTGNLQVDGTTTTINSTTYTVDDLNITLASGAGSSSAADGAGITIDGASATWNYTHSNTSWVANKNVRAPRFLTTSNSSSNFYSVLATRSGSGTSNPDIYGSSNTLVLGYSDSGKAVHFNSTGATFTGTISSGAITSTGTLGITGAISSGADTTLATFGRSGSAVSSSIIYADATTDMEFGTTTAHALSLITGDTRRLTIDSSGNATFSAHLIVDGNTTLGNADTDTVSIPGDLAVDTDTLFVDVSADRVGINDNSPDEVLTLKSDAGGIRIKGVTTATKGLSLRYDESAGESEIRSDQTGVNQINLKYRALNHIFGRNNALEYMRITDGGLVGIGRTPSTGNLLDVAGRGYFGSVGTGEGNTKANMETNAVLKLKPHDGNSTNMTFAQVNSGAGIGIQVSNGPQTANWDIALNPYGGNVGIGTVDPSSLLTIKNNGSGGTWPLRIFNSQDSDMLAGFYESSSGDGYHGMLYLNDGGGTTDVKLSTNGASWFNGGSVGIGTDSPDSNSKLTITDGATPYSVANTLMQIKRNASNGSGNDDSARSAISICNNSNGFTLAYGGTTDRFRILDGGNAERLSITNGGRVGINSTGGVGSLNVYGTVSRGDAHGDPDVTKSYGTNITAVNGSCIEIQTSIASSNTSPTCVITWNKGAWAAFSYFFQYSGASYSGGRYGGGYHNNSNSNISGHNESGYGSDYLTITGSGQTLYFSFGFPSGYHPSIYARFMGGGGMGTINADEFTVAWTT